MTTNVLTVSLSDLPLSKELKTHFHQKGYKNLQDVLQHQVSVLMSQPGFCYHMLQDFLQFLKQHNLTTHLQE